MKKALAENIADMDLALFQLIFGWNGKSFWDNFFRLITHCSGICTYTLAGVVLVIFGDNTQKQYIIAALIAFSLELPVYKLIKLSCKRCRPFDQLKGIQSLIAVPDRYSFPSGHTAAAFVTASILTVYDPLFCQPAFIWAALVGISRIYLGVHFPTDVLAGLALGLLSAQVALFIVF